MKFESKYGINELVSFDPHVKDEGKDLFGFIQKVEFRKVDAVNYVADYTIESVNTGEVMAGVHESAIKRRYVET